MAPAAEKQKNGNLDVAKVVAACFVVFVHVPFPGRSGMAVTGLARFAVPFFFAVSGYYSLDAGPETLKRRSLHLGKLHLIAAVLSVAVGCISRIGAAEDLAYYLRWGILPDTREIVRWVVLQENPYGGQLWYLSSALLCYLVLLAYRKFWGGETRKNGPLYIAGFVLFALFGTLSLLGTMEGMDIPYMVYRNGWLLGIPMFLMGMFLHEYEERLLENFHLTSRRMLLWMALGVALTLMQSLNGYPAEIPFGMLILVPVLLLFLMKHPRLPVKSPWVLRVVSRFGVVSTAMYLLHIPALDLYDLFLKEDALALFGTKEDTLMPVLVLMLTFAGAFVWERTDALMNRKK